MPCCTFKNPETFPKLAVLVIIQLMLIRFCDISIITAVKYSYTPPSDALLLLLQLVLPVVALYGNIKCGTFNLSVTGVLVSLIIIVVKIFQSLLVLEDIQFEPLSIVTDILAQVLIVSHELTTLSLLLLGGDQLTEGSSQQLSSFIWWFTWCLHFGWAVSSLVSCSLHTKTDPYGLLYIECGHALSLCLIFFSLVIFKKAFTSGNQVHVRQSGNPLSIIRKVLNFALRKSNYSALHYYDHPRPSRIDLAKTTFGGPFTYDDVESVKTFFRLLSLIFVVYLVEIPTTSLGRTQYSHQTLPQCLISSTYFVMYIVFLIVIPIKQFVLQCIHSPTVRLLQRIGFGIFLLLVSHVILTAIDFYISLLADHTNVTCSLNSVDQNITYYDSKHLYFIGPQVIQGIAAVFILPTTLEFLYAQSPYNFRILIIGISLSVVGIYELIGWELVRLFSLPFLAKAQPSCDVYVFLIGTFVIFCSLVLYLFVSKWYKLHQREYTHSYTFFNRSIFAYNYNSITP